MCYITFNIKKQVRKYNLLSHFLMKSRDRSTAFASAVKLDESSGNRIILQLLSDITADLFDPSVFIYLFI